MSYINIKNRNKLERKINKKYKGRKIFLIFSMVILAVTVGLIFMSFMMTIKSVVQLQNDGLANQEIWIEISKEWWSFISLTNEPVKGTSIYLSFSYFGIAMLSLFGVSVVLLITSIVLVLTARSPNESAQIAQKLDNDIHQREVVVLKKQIHKLQLEKRSLQRKLRKNVKK